jgi:hypothetical protein
LHNKTTLAITSVGAASVTIAAQHFPAEDYDSDKDALLKANYSPTPMCLQEVLQSPLQDKWMAAMNKEFSALVLNGTFDLVKLPASWSTISTHWVLRIKPDGTFKAHFVACSFSQHEGVDYEDTYAPVLWLENLWFLLTYTILMGLEIHQMDVDNTFLQAILEEEVYVTQPEGFVDATQPSFVCCLKKALYSLKQALLAWNCTLNAFLLNLSFTATTADPCIYSYHHHNADPYDTQLHWTYLLNNNQHQIFLSVYINDLLIIGHINNINFIKQKLASQFQMKDLGPITMILGIKVVHDNA